MNWKKRLTITGLAGVLIIGSTGCPSDPSDVDNDDTPVDEPTLESFDVSPSAITSGDDVQGEVELEWEAQDAESVVLLANDSELDLADCEPADGDDCLDGGSLVHEPDEDTTYRIEVLSDADADCEIDDGDVQNPELCASESADVEVFAPAVLSLERDEDRFPQNEEFSVDFDVEDARDFEIGIVGDDGELDDICEVDGDGVCSRPDAESGELTLSDLDRSITLSGWAENGADDGLGDVTIGDVELELHPEGAPVIRLFRADPAHVPFGGETTLHWETEDTAEIEISSDFEGIIDTDLSECSEIDDNGEGECDIQFADEEFDDLDVTFTAVAFSDDNEESAPYEIGIVLGQPPVIDLFDVVDEDDKSLPADGGDIELEWDIDNQPTHLEIQADGETILDTDDDVGVEHCQSGDDECDLSADVFSVDGVEEPTTFSLTATSPIGSDSASVSVSVEGAPEIETLTVDGDDATEAPVVVDAESATVAWTTDETDETQLDRADKPEDGCDSSAVDWNAVDGFGGEASGDFEIEGLDQTEECFRLTATEDDAGQSASLTFKIARAPLVTSFDVDPDTTTAGEDVTLSWETPFASEVVVDSPDTGHINENDLDDCTDVDGNFQGSCEVQISPGSSASSVEFSIYAIGFDDVESNEDDVTVFLGEPPEIENFCAQAESAGDCASSTSAQDDMEDITLEWDLEEDNATSLTITDGQGNVEYESDDPDQSGAHTVDGVSQTTSWTLDVSNDFGSDASEATAFFGPVIHHFEVNGEEAVGEDEVQIPTGDIAFNWVTDDTDDVYLDYGEVDLDADDCTDVVDWTEIASGDPDDDHMEPGVSQNGCYRLIAENPDQTSSVTIFVRTIPFVSTSITTNVDSFVGEEGEDVFVQTSVFGGQAVTFNARFYDSEDDDAPNTESISDCNETGMGGDADDEVVDCIHDMEGEYCTGTIVAGACTGGSWVNDPPEGTEYIGYEVCAFDQNGDSSCDVTADDDRVEVEW